jgi:hypothetical protein
MPNCSDNAILKMTILEANVILFKDREEELK